MTLLIPVWRWVQYIFRAHVIKFLLTKSCSGKKQIGLRQQSVTQLYHYSDSTKPPGNKLVRKQTWLLWNLRTVGVGSSSAAVRSKIFHSVFWGNNAENLETGYSLLLFMHWYNLHSQFVSSLFPNLVHTEGLKFTEDRHAGTFHFNGFTVLPTFYRLWNGSECRGWHCYHCTCPWLS